MSCERDSRKSKSRWRLDLPADFELPPAAIKSLAKLFLEWGRDLQRKLTPPVRSVQ